jgi:hypothetical protein
MSSREELARAQAELLRALSEDGPVPEGFDAARVRAAADGLLAKRRRSVRRAWPGLSAALGERFTPEFDVWARAHPVRDVEPHAGVEGYHFASALREAGRLPERAEEELLRFELGWRLTPEGGVAARRGLGLRWVRLGPGGRVLALRLPGGRLWRWRLPGGGSD